MNHITPFDDYPIHQAASPIAVPSSTDRNFYDRYWFNGIDPDTNYIFEIGIAILASQLAGCHFHIPPCNTTTNLLSCPAKMPYVH